jgi:hypothetical protein
MKFEPAGPFIQRLLRTPIENHETKQQTFQAQGFARRMLSS